MLNSDEHRQYPNCPNEIPTELLNEDWAQRIHSQSLALLNERGGLHPKEIICNIKKVSYSAIRHIETRDAIKAINKLINDHTL